LNCSGGEKYGAIVFHTFRLVALTSFCAHSGLAMHDMTMRKKITLMFLVDANGIVAGNCSSPF
jgi:hypothetical protein